MDASVIGEIWSAVLDGETVRADDDFFFNLGGNSLMAGAVISTMAEQVGLPLQLQDLYLAPTPREFAEYLTHLENRMAQLAAQVTESDGWNLEVFVTALAELGSAAAETFLPAESTLVCQPVDGSSRSPASSRLSLLRHIRGNGMCTIESGEGSSHLIHRDNLTLRVTAERTPEAVKIYFHEV